MSKLLLIPVAALCLLMAPEGIARERAVPGFDDRDAPRDARPPRGNQGGDARGPRRPRPGDHGDRGRPPPRGTDADRAAAREAREQRRQQHRQNQRERWESMSESERQAARERMQTRRENARGGGTNPYKSPIADTMNRFVAVGMTASPIVDDEVHQSTIWTRLELHAGL